MLEITRYVNIVKEDGFAIINIDVQGEKMNIISPELIEVFDEVFEQLNQDSDTKAIILTSAKKDFIAGADIKAFKAEKKGDFLPIVRKGHESMFKIERSKKPIIAAISGTCYGLGTELSLACHARIISDEPHSKMALPEVKLGLLPGAGGTQRLPRLIGVSGALDMMLTGKNIFPHAAKKMGLVDEVVNKNKLISAAKSIALRLMQGTYRRSIQKPLFTRLLDHTALGNYIVFRQARKTVMRATQGNYPAPFEILHCVQYGLKQGMQNGLAMEAEKFETLMLGDVSKELIGLFFAMAENKKNPYPQYVKQIDQLAIIGAGFMGAGIAEISMDAGIKVILKDLQSEVITAAKKNIWVALDKKIKKRIATENQALKSIGLVSGTLEYKEISSADLVIEAVVEKMEVKKQVIQEIESACQPGVIFATNTSSLSIKEMELHAKHPENIIGMHYFSPVPKMPLLEIVTTEATSKEAIATAYELGIRQGKTCIVVKDGPGFYVNRILAPYLNECLLMIEEGVDIETIDKIFVKKGFPVGPIKLVDEVGIDIVVHATNANKAYAAKRKGYLPNKGLEKMFESGFLGKKNKKGFYHYDPVTGKSKGFNTEVYSFFGGKRKNELAIQLIQDRALMLMLQEAVMCLQEGIIANKNDGNLAAIFGIGFPPFSGGPFKMIEAMGENQFKEKLSSLASQCGDRFNQIN
jgi:3-hydroxyacyl-CoA dehydrogenase/enoyl-CoA hydratase/3-hydroxybutyryl-CoA epimerase